VGITTERVCSMVQLNYQLNTSNSISTTANTGFSSEFSTLRRATKRETKSRNNRNGRSLFLHPVGDLLEWLKRHAWKVCIRETVSRVRIPQSPQLKLKLQKECRSLPFYRLHLDITLV
jgi:hypothetical protein